VKHVYLLGENLEAAKRYSEASYVYLDIANKKFGQHLLIPEECSRKAAPLAFKRDMN
jgi:hypothetical protein